MTLRSGDLFAARFEIDRAAGAGGMGTLAGRRLLGKPTPCVGRERELSALEAVLTECREELLSRAVLVLAPPGLGKSRLRHEFVRRLDARGERVAILTGRGDPMRAKSTYGLLGEALRQRLGIMEGQDPAEQQARLAVRIGAQIPGPDARRVTMFIGELCGVPFPDDESPELRAARQEPRIMSDQVEQAWLDGLCLMRADEPLLLILEDLHWSDALTVKLVGATLRRLSDHAFMVLALARPEVVELYPNLWAGWVQPLPLLPLATKAGEQLIRGVLGQDVASEDVTRIVEQSAGNPLLLEELIRAAAEGKTAELPATVAAMIQARIGRLAAATRRALRAASVFGETFWEHGVASLLSAAHGKEPLRCAIEELVREEIIERVPERRFVEGTQYRFRHALVRDAAYGLLSVDETAAFHAAAGAFLEEAGEREAIILAEHYRLGQKPAKSISFYRRAAGEAHEAGNMDSALVFIERGLALGAEGADRAMLQTEQVSIKFWRNDLSAVLASAPEALSELNAGSKAWCRVFYALLPTTLLSQPDLFPDRKEQFLAVEPEPDARPFYVHAAAMLAMSFIATGQKALAAELRERVQKVARLATDDPNTQSHALFIEALHAHFTVKLPYTNLLHCEAASRLAAEAGNRHFLGGVEVYRAKALGHLGRWSEATDVFRASIELAGQLKDDFVLSHARVFLAMTLATHPALDPRSEVEELARQALSTNHPSAVGLAHGVLSRVAFARRDLATAEEEARTACQILSMFPPYRPDIVAFWSRILRTQGRESESLSVCEDAVAELEALGIEPYGLIDLYVALAEARARSGMERSAQQAAGRAMIVLARRTRDLPDDEARATYLREVTENVRLLELAAQWRIEPEAESA